MQPGLHVTPRHARRPSPALVLAMISLLVSLTGTAAALDGKRAGKIKTKQIARGAVTTPKLRNGAVNAAKVTPGSLTAAQVAANSLTGAQIDESTLAGIPVSGQAGGDLTGSYPNPQLAPGTVTAADVAAVNVDGAAGTPSLRTLGGGAQQAMPGNAVPGGPPTGAAGGALAGTYPSPSLAAASVGTAQTATLPAFRAPSIAPQVVSPSVPYDLFVWNEAYDTSGSFDAEGGVWTVPVTGIYAIDAAVDWQNAGAATLAASIVSGQLGAVAQSIVPATAGTLTIQPLGTQVGLIAGDTVRVRISHNAAGPLTLLPDGTQFAATWLAPLPGG